MTNQCRLDKVRDLEILVNEISFDSAQDDCQSEPVCLYVHIKHIKA
jgi:hypothetical protein